jgi:signal transduction histidine kinase
MTCRPSSWDAISPARAPSTDLSNNRGVRQAARAEADFAAGHATRVAGEAHGPPDHAADEVVVAVRDNGPGVPQAEQEAIFREFYGGRGEHTHSKGGVGLGLAIARRVARLLDGELRVESEVGMGSTFSLRVPYRIPDISEEEPDRGARMS